MKSKAMLIVSLLAVLCLASFGCSQPCNCSCGCDNCTCNSNTSSKATATAASNSGANTTNYTVSISSNDPATNDERYQDRHSEVTTTAAEPAVVDGQECVKVTLTLSVSGNTNQGDMLTYYRPTAYQNNVQINGLKDTYPETVEAISKQVLPGGNVSADFYYPVGDYSDITIKIGHDSSERHQGTTVIHFEKK